jgi:hypothetical protein
VSLEQEKLEAEREEPKTFLAKTLGGVALLSLFFWPSQKRALARPVEVKKATHSIPRVANQSGRLEKA